MSREQDGGGVRAQRLDLLRELAATPAGAWITCAGRSMEPTLRLGQQVRVRVGRARIGDVVLFETADRTTYVLHRLVWRAPGVPWFLHLGDAGSPLGPRFARVERIVGVAELPRRLPGPRTAAAVARALVRGAVRLARRLRRR